MKKQKLLKSFQIIFISLGSFFISNCKSNIIYSNYLRNDFQIAECFYDHTKPTIDDMDNQKLLTAVKESDYDTAKRILKEIEKKKFVYSPNIYDNIQQTALMWACWYDDYDMVRILCEYQKNYAYKIKKLEKIDTNKTSVNNYSAMFCSAYRGNDIIMQYLLKHGATILPNNKDNNSENILHKMAKSKKAGNIKNFIEKNSNFAWKEMLIDKDNNGYTPFHYAVTKKDLSMVISLYELAKKHNVEKIVLNTPARLGEDEVYPLNTAFSIDSIEIFYFLLNQSPLNMENYTVSMFDNISEDALYKFISNDNYYTNAFYYRQEWDKNKNGKLDVRPTKINNIENAIISLVKGKYEQNSLLEESDFETFDAAIEKLDKLKHDHFNNISDIAKGTGSKDLLELSVDSPKWSVEEKKKLIDWILGDGTQYYSNNPDNDILCYCLKNSSKERPDFLNIAKYLINNRPRFQTNYKFRQSEYYKNTHVLLMTNKYIRTTLSPKEMIELLDTIAKDYKFYEEQLKENFYCAILGDTQDNPNIDLSNPDEMTENLFKYFEKQITQIIDMDKIPLCTWCYRRNFKYGVEEILYNPELAKNSYLDTQVDEKNKKIIDYFKKDKEVKLIEQYKKIYDEDSKNNVHTKTEKSKDKSKKKSKNKP